MSSYSRLSFPELKTKAVSLGIRAAGAGRTRAVLEKEIGELESSQAVGVVTPSTIGAKIVTNDAPVLFFGYSAKKAATNPYLVLSNWAYSPFVDKDDHWFASNEVYMMWRKATLFGDQKVAAEILALIPKPVSDKISQEPDGWRDLMQRVKKLGKKVKGFTDEVWEANREQIMEDGLYLKVKQNKKVEATLLATRNRLIAEAAPRDKIWGIGMGKTNPEAQDPTKWKGLNLLGKALMRVRERLVAESQ